MSDPCAVVFRLCMYHTPMTTSILSPQVHFYLCYLQDIAYERFNDCNNVVYNNNVKD